MKQKERRIYCVENYIKCFPLLVSKLSREEVVCLSHCLVFDDCAADGDCELQDKVNSILEK